MLKLIGSALVTAVLGTVFMVPVGSQDEESIPLDKLPAKVTAAVKARFPGAELVEATKEIDNGTTIYEVALKVKGHSIDLSALPDGTIIFVETLVTEKSLPQGVSDAIAAKYAGAKIAKAEEIMTINWEVLLTLGSETLEVKFDGSGKVIEETKKSGDGK